MKKLLALILAMSVAYTAPATQAHADNLEDLLKALVVIGIGAIVVGSLMDENAQIGMSVQFEQDGQRGFFQYVGEGEGRNQHRGRRCRQYDVIYTDECGNPTGVVETRIECKNRRGQWETVSAGDFSGSRSYHGAKPQPFCGFDDTEADGDWQQDDEFLDDGSWTQGTELPPPFIEMEQPQRPKHPHGDAPSIILNEQPPALIPMNNDNQPGFFFPQVVQ